MILDMQQSVFIENVTAMPGWVYSYTTQTPGQSIGVGEIIQTSVGATAVIQGSVGDVTEAGDW